MFYDREQHQKSLKGLKGEKKVKQGSLESILKNELVSYYESRSEFGKQEEIRFRNVKKKCSNTEVCV